jgi:hypothetical protein
MTSWSSVPHPRLVPLFVSAFTLRSLEAHEILIAVAQSAGAFGSASSFAKSLGYPSRHHLARALSKNQLPLWQDLVGWATVLHWLLEWENNGTAVSRLALRTGRDPAACYRLVQRLTGRRWSEVARLGSDWLVGELRREYRHRQLDATGQPEWRGGVNSRKRRAWQLA